MGKVALSNFYITLLLTILFKDFMGLLINLLGPVEFAIAAHPKKTREFWHRRNSSKAPFNHFLKALILILRRREMRELERLRSNTMSNDFIYDFEPELVDEEAVDELQGKSAFQS